MGVNTPWLHVHIIFLISPCLTRYTCTDVHVAFEGKSVRLGVQCERALAQPRISRTRSAQLTVCKAPWGENTPQHKVSRGMLNLPLCTVLCLVLPKIASYIQHVCACRGADPLFYWDMHIYVQYVSDLCVHTAQTVRHAWLCLTLMDQQLVNQVMQCARHTKIVSCGAVCHIRCCIKAEPVLVLLKKSIPIDSYR